MDACDSSIIYSLEERRGIIKKKKKGEKEKKMEENGEKVGNTMKQNLFCVESCSQGLLVELSRFPSETNSTVLFFLFSSLFFFFLPFYN